MLVILAACSVPEPEPTRVDPPIVLAEVAFEPGPAVTNKLTRAQYLTAAEALFGEGLTLSVALEPDARKDGLTALGAGVTAVSPRGVEEYEVAAYDLAAQAISPERRAAWVPCEPAGAEDPACAEQALAPLARRAWRRAVTATELATLVEVAGGAGATLDDFWSGLAYGVAAVLQSPHFLYRVEKGETDPQGGIRRSADELATRLSFLLTDAPPDDALLDAAAQGELDTPEGLEAQARRLLALPAVRGGVRGWITDVLKLDALDRLDKDPVLFPNISPTLGSSAREETLRFTEHLVVEEDADLRTLLTSRTTFVNRELAALYRLPAPSLKDFAQVELPADGERRGLLGGVSFLASHSHSTASSATLRGYAIRAALLCDPLPPPPTGVDTSIPPSDAERPTLRERVEAHMSVPSCRGCHEAMDLLGLPLENFDAVGRWRDTEGEHAIDATGALNGVNFDGPRAMAEVIADDPMFTRCMVLQVVRRALGREPTVGEEPMVEALTDNFLQRGARLQPLWLDIVSSPMFRNLEGK